MKHEGITRKTIFEACPQALKLLQILNENNAQTRIIGGAVRNALLGMPIGDIDIATTLLPNEVIQIAKAAGYKTVPTGIAHGTVTVVVNKIGFEVTALRQDIETDGRHAKVSYTTDFSVDAQRRDFTVNALSICLTGAIYDYTGGRADLQEGIIRFIGDPVQRIREDYLRILRFFRFSACYSKRKLDEAGLKACLSEQAGLKQISRERIGNEVRKWLVAPRVLSIMKELMHSNLLIEIFGQDVKVNSFFKTFDFESICEIETSFIRRLAALTYHDSQNIQSALKLSNKENQHFQAIYNALNNENYKVSALPHDLKPILYRLGKQVFIDWLLIKAEDTQIDCVKIGLKLAEKWAIPKNPFTAQMFIEHGLSAGKRLGICLKHAEQSWLEQDFPNDATQIEQIVKECVAANLDVV